MEEKIIEIKVSTIDIVNRTRKKLLQVYHTRDGHEKLVNTLNQGLAKRKTTAAMFRLRYDFTETKYANLSEYIRQNSHV